MMNKTLSELARRDTVEIDVVGGEAAERPRGLRGIAGWLGQRRKTRETSRARA